jgi:hypothetical protein
VLVIVLSYPVKSPHVMDDSYFEVVKEKYGNSTETASDGGASGMFLVQLFARRAAKPPDEVKSWKKRNLTVADSCLCMSLDPRVRRFSGTRGTSVSHRRLFTPGEPLIGGVRIVG